MRRTSRFTLQMGAAAAALALIAGACGSSHSSSTGGSGGGGSSGASSQIYANNSGGTPVKGGTLTMLGTGDVDYMDPNVSYYSIGYLGLREWSREPVSPTRRSRARPPTPAPDLATALPSITDGGLKYAVTIRTGAMWDTSPARQVTAADVVRGVERSCNPTQPFGGQPDFSDILAGYTAFCSGFANVSATSATAQAAYINDNAYKLTGVTVDPSNPLTVDFTLTKPATYFTDILTLPPFVPAPVEYPAVPAGQQCLGPAHHFRRALQGAELRPGQVDRLRPQPGVERQHRPDPQGLREPDRRLRDGAAAGDLAGGRDQHAAGRHAVGRRRAHTGGPGPHLQQVTWLLPADRIRQQPVRHLQHRFAQQQRGSGQSCRCARRFPTL